MADYSLDCFTHPAHVELDTSGLRCPMPLLKTKQALRTMSANDILRVITTDAASVRDFKAFTDLSGHLLLAMGERSDSYYYLIQKSA